MSKELTKKAVDMLLKGATLLGDPCPYCKGVRVMKDGYALCVSCGKEPEIEKSIPKSSEEEKSVPKDDSAVMVLEQKLKKMSKELEQEKDHEKQQEILKSINSIVEILNKLKK